MVVVETLVGLLERLSPDADDALPHMEVLLDVSHMVVHDKELLVGMLQPPEIRNFYGVMHDFITWPRYLTALQLLTRSIIRVTEAIGVPEVVEHDPDGLVPNALCLLCDLGDLASAPSPLQTSFFEVGLEVASRGLRTTCRESGKEGSNTRRLRAWLQLCIAMNLESFAIKRLSEAIAMHSAFESTWWTDGSLAQTVLRCAPTCMNPNVSEMWERIVNEAQHRLLALVLCSASRRRHVVEGCGQFFADLHCVVPVLPQLIRSPSAHIAVFGCLLSHVRSCAGGALGPITCDGEIITATIEALSVPDASATSWHRSASDACDERPVDEGDDASNDKSTWATRGLRLWWCLKLLIEMETERAPTMALTLGIKKYDGFAAQIPLLEIGYFFIREAAMVDTGVTIVVRDMVIRVAKKLRERYQRGETDEDTATMTNPPQRDLLRAAKIASGLNFLASAMRSGNSHRHVSMLTLLTPSVFQSLLEVLCLPELPDTLRLPIFASVVTILKVAWDYAPRDLPAYLIEFHVLPLLHAVAHRFLSQALWAVPTDSAAISLPFSELRDALLYGPALRADLVIMSVAACCDFTQILYCDCPSIREYMHQELFRVRAGDVGEHDVGAASTTEVESAVANQFEATSEIFTNHSVAHQEDDDSLCGSDDPVLHADAHLSTSVHRAFTTDNLRAMLEEVGTPRSSTNNSPIARFLAEQDAALVTSAPIHAAVHTFLGLEAARIDAQVLLENLSFVTAQSLQGRVSRLRQATDEARSAFDARRNASASSLLHAAATHHTGFALALRFLVCGSMAGDEEVREWGPLLNHALVDLMFQHVPVKHLKACISAASEVDFRPQFAWFFERVLLQDVYALPPDEIATYCEYIAELLDASWLRVNDNEQRVTAKGVMKLACASCVVNGRSIFAARSSLCQLFVEIPPDTWRLLMDEMVSEWCSLVDASDVAKAASAKGYNLALTEMIAVHETVWKECQGAAPVASFAVCRDLLEPYAENEQQERQGVQANHVAQRIFRLAPHDPDTSSVTLVAYLSAFMHSWPAPDLEELKFPMWMAHADMTALIAQRSMAVWGEGKWQRVPMVVQSKVLQHFVWLIQCADKLDAFVSSASDSRPHKVVRERMLKLVKDDVMEFLLGSRVMPAEHMTRLLPLLERIVLNLARFLDTESVVDFWEELVRKFLSQHLDDVREGNAGRSSVVPLLRLLAIPMFLRMDHEQRLPDVPVQSQVVAFIAQQLMLRCEVWKPPSGDEASLGNFLVALESVLLSCKMQVDPDVTPYVSNAVDMNRTSDALLSSDGEKRVLQPFVQHPVWQWESGIVWPHELEKLRSIITDRSNNGPTKVLLAHVEAAACLWASGCSEAFRNSFSTTKDLIARLMCRVTVRLTGDADDSAAKLLAFLTSGPSVEAVVRFLEFDEASASPPAEQGDQQNSWSDTVIVNQLVLLGMLEDETKVLSTAHFHRVVSEIIDEVYWEVHEFDSVPQGKEAAVVMRIAEGNPIHDAVVKKWVNDMMNQQGLDAVEAKHRVSQSAASITLLDAGVLLSEVRFALDKRSEWPSFLETFFPSMCTWVCLDNTVDEATNAPVTSTKKVTKSSKKSTKEPEPEPAAISLSKPFIVLKPLRLAGSAQSLDLSITASASLLRARATDARLRSWMLSVAALPTHDEQTPHRLAKLLDFTAGYSSRMETGMILRTKAGKQATVPIIRDVLEVAWTLVDGCSPALSTSRPAANAAIQLLGNALPLLPQLDQRKLAIRLKMTEETEPISRHFNRLWTWFQEALVCGEAWAPLLTKHSEESGFALLLHLYSLRLASYCDIHSLKTKLPIQGKLCVDCYGISDDRASYVSGSNGTDDSNADVGQDDNGTATTSNTNSSDGDEESEPEVRQRSRGTAGTLLQLYESDSETIIGGIRDGESGSEWSASANSSDEIEGDDYDQMVHDKKELRLAKRSIVLMIQTLQSGLTGSRSLVEQLHRGASAAPPSSGGKKQRKKDKASDAGKGGEEALISGGSMVIVPRKLSGAETWDAALSQVVVPMSVTLWRWVRFAPLLPSEQRVAHTSATESCGAPRRLIDLNSVRGNSLAGVIADVAPFMVLRGQLAHQEITGVVVKACATDTMLMTVFPSLVQASSAVPGRRMLVLRILVGILRNRPSMMTACTRAMSSGEELDATSVQKAHFFVAMMDFFLLPTMSAISQRLFHSVMRSTYSSTANEATDEREHAAEFDNDGDDDDGGDDVEGSDGNDSNAQDAVADDDGEDEENVDDDEGVNVDCDDDVEAGERTASRHRHSSNRTHSHGATASGANAEDTAMCDAAEAAILASLESNPLLPTTTISSRLHPCRLSFINVVSLPLYGRTFACDRCHKSSCDAYGFHCGECSYDECVKCHLQGEEVHDDDFDVGGPYYQPESKPERNESPRHWRLGSLQFWRLAVQHTPVVERMLTHLRRPNVVMACGGFLATCVDEFLSIAAYPLEHSCFDPRKPQTPWIPSVPWSRLQEDFVKPIVTRIIAAMDRRMAVLGEVARRIAAIDRRKLSQGPQQPVLTPSGSSPTSHKWAFEEVADAIFAMDALQDDGVSGCHDFKLLPLCVRACTTQHELETVVARAVDRMWEVVLSHFELLTVVLSRLKEGTTELQHVVSMSQTDYLLLAYLGKTYRAINERNRLIDAIAHRLPEERLHNMYSPLTPPEVPEVPLMVRSSSFASMQHYNTASFAIHRSESDLFLNDVAAMELRSLDVAVGDAATAVCGGTSSTAKNNVSCKRSSALRHVLSHRAAPSRLPFGDELFEQYVHEVTDPWNDERTEQIAPVVRVARRYRSALNFMFCSIGDADAALDEGIAFLLTDAKILDFSIRLGAFQSKMQAFIDDAPNSTELTIARDRLMHSSLHELHSLHEMCSEFGTSLGWSLEVTFVDEEALDAGGVKREWFTLITQRILESMSTDEAAATSRDAIIHRERDGQDVSLPPCFIRNTGAATGCLELNPTLSSCIKDDPSLGELLRLIGMTVGLAMVYRTPLDLHLSRATYSHMIGQQPGFRELEATDPELYKNLKYLMSIETDEEMEALCLTFSAPSGIVSDKADDVEVPLCAGGADMAVTLQNRAEYIRLRAEHRMTTRVAESLSAFMDGFHFACPVGFLQCFTVEDIEIVSCGVSFIDVEDLRANASYEGYRAEAQVVRWFWECCFTMSQQDLVKLVQFATASTRSPAGGFSTLNPKFTLARCPPSDNLPVAHTCVNRIDLPEYDSIAMLREKLLQAVTLGSVGFGLV